ncbi:hypothetical protein HY642_02845, partial [Candidatus Woesearchaeota archaeon]|nr:hypothetical protein [Candidatus Woesearchaeota archaeon]
MIIKVSPDLKWQEIWAQGPELAGIMGMDRSRGTRVLSYQWTKKRFVHAFLNPILMTDNHRIAKLNTTLRESLFALYASQPRVVEYDGVSTAWNHSYTGVWCPSIDTILFAKALRDFLPGKRIRTAAEIGTGSGFLSKYLLAKARGVKSVLVNDLNAHAVRSAMDNI